MNQDFDTRTKEAKAERARLESQIADYNKKQKESERQKKSEITWSDAIFSIVAAIIFLFLYNSCSGNKSTQSYTPPPNASMRESQAEAALQPYKDARCEALGDVGSKAFIAKVGGHSLNTALSVAVIPGRPTDTKMAQGVVLAIYGDNAIQSSSQARSIAVGACKSAR